MRGGVLLLIFAIPMTIALGPEPPLSNSVWTAAAGAFLLATHRPAAKLEAVPDSSAPRNTVMDNWLGHPSRPM